jgi:putative glutathione S-transferase
MSSNFRNVIPSERFPVEKGRYVLYFNHVCPWAHRAVIVRALKGLENIIQLVEVDARDPTNGWYFSGHRGPDKDPQYKVRWLKELYLKADPTYKGRVTIPMLWDKVQGKCSIYIMKYYMLTLTRQGREQRERRDNSHDVHCLR